MRIPKARITVSGESTIASLQMRLEDAQDRIRQLRAEVERLKEALGEPQEWASKVAELQAWTGSAYLAGEPIKDEQATRSALYSFLCGLTGWLMSAEDAARALQDTQEPKPQEGER